MNSRSGNPPIRFDQVTGRLIGTNPLDRVVALALQAGALGSASFAYRGYSLGCRALAPLISERELIVELNDDARFAFPFGDGYWGRLLNRHDDYEPEIGGFLRSIANVDYTFVDGGANFGFWSELVSSALFGRHRSIATEASSANARRLRRNAELNGNRFTVKHKALSMHCGRRVWIGGHKHEAFRVLTAGQEGLEEAETVSLDALLDSECIPNDARLVIKLDVEGAEIDALKGGHRVLNGDSVVICEDHGADRLHTVSRFILNETDCHLFILDPVSRRFQRLTDLSALDRIKANRSIGYNVLATQSAFWKERISSIPSIRRGMHYSRAENPLEVHR